ncbi:MAG: nucleoside hydrolase [Alphaproteobacteria bacterium]
MSRIKLIIDTDPGIDDAMAILYAAAHPKLELIGLTTVFGNVPVATATRNALFLAELAGLAIPVAEGAAAPLARPKPQHPAFIHGVEGFGALPPVRPASRADPRPAARYLTETAAAHPGEVTICAIGPLTNLAAALALDPEFADNVGRVVLMGGAVACPGNTTPEAEANIFCDPHAATAVLGAGWPVTLVGLDVTRQVKCTAGDFAGLARAAPVTGGFLDRAVQLYLTFHRERHGGDGCSMHDPTAVIEITDQGLFETRGAAVEVTLEGEAAGRTRCATAGPAVRVCMGVDAAAVRARFLEVIGKADACRGGATG